MSIDNFRDEYYFLSNFYECPIIYRGIRYKNNEAAFQSMKTENILERHEFSELNPSKAKHKGRKVTLRKDWEEIKDQIMYEVVKSKFTQNDDLRLKLLSTGEEELIEGNDWNDTYWGMCSGEGKNMLGKILMRVREEVKTVDYRNFDYENHIS